MAEYFAASEPSRPPPYTAPVPLDRQTVSDKLKAAFAKLERQDARDGRR